MNWQNLLSRLLTIVSSISGLTLAGGAWNFIKCIPSMVNIVKNILSLVNDAENYIERLKKLKEFEKAIEEAKLSGNTSALEKMFGGTGK